MSAREYLEKANRYQVKPEELFQYFSQNVMKLTVLYQKSSLGKKPLLARSNRPGSKYVVAFTDQEAAKMVRVRQPEYLEMTDEPALPFLLKAYRSNAEGLMFNPGIDSRFFVVQHQLLEWIRYYCIHMFSKKTDAWVIRSGSSVLKGAYQPGFSTIVVYTGEQEASKSAEKSGGVATSISWEKIFQYLERLGSKTLYVNYGLPEAFLLNPDQVEQIKKGSKTGYVEQTTNSYSFIPDVPDLPIPSETESVESLSEESPISEEEQITQTTETEVLDWESAFTEEEPLTFGTDRKTEDTYTSEAPVVPKNEEIDANQHQLPISSTEERIKEKKPNINITPEQKVEKIEPVVKPAPVVKPESVIKPEPVVKPAPVVKPEPVVKPAPVVKPEPVVKPAPVMKTEPVVEPEPVVKPTPVSVDQDNEEQEQNLKNENVQEEQNTVDKQEESTVSENTYSAFDNPWDDDDDDGFSETIPHTSLFFQSDNQIDESENEKNIIPEPEPIPETTFQQEEQVVKVEEKPVQSNEQPQVESENVPPTSTFNPSIPEDVAYGLRVLETATNEGKGMANGWEVCRALADLRRIWVIVDLEGKMVILASQDENQIADFFTSEEYAQTLIDEAHRRNSTLPKMVPRLISTKKLFKALAPTQCIIWINRGSPNAWTSIMGDTLPYVLQLMAQK